MPDKPAIAEPVTLDEIRKIRLLSRTAAPRPWRVVYKQELPEDPAGKIESRLAGLRFADGAMIGFDWQGGAKTMEFIVHACNAVVAMADEVERLRNENAELLKRTAPKAAAAGGRPGPGM